MIRILSIFLLLVYSLTSTGATVYYHTCGQNSQISIFEKQNNSKACAFCTGDEGSCSLEQQEQDHTDTSCELDHTCCTDVQVELNNGDDQAVTNLLKDFNTLSPAEFIIPWIMVFHHALFDAPAPNKTTLASLVPTGTFPNTYLVNCNFRI